MTADTRAEITCSLGTVISGGISDSYIQNAGLIKTKGQLTILGVKTPVLGRTINLGWKSLNSTQNLNRSLRVLSSFADPLKGITEVSVGCTLTYQEQVQPLPSLENGEANFVNPRLLECQNGLPPSAFVPPIYANDVFRFCTQRLGINPAGANLQNTYCLDEFDLSSGYVAAIDSLLLSEGLVGWMETFTQLRVFDWDNSSGSRIPFGEILELSSINSGELPPDIVLVPYIDKKLQKYEPDDQKWEEIFIESDPQLIVLDTKDQGQFEVEFAPSTETYTVYGEPVDLTDQCELYAGGFGDLSNTVISTETYRTTCVGHSAGGYATALLQAEVPIDLLLVGLTAELVFFEFDEKDRIIKQETEIYEPEFVYGGRMSLPWVFYDDNDEVIDYVQLTQKSLLVQQTIVEYEYAADDAFVNSLEPGADVQDGIVWQRQKTRVYKAFGMTQGGSQAPAESTNQEAFTSESQVLEYIENSLGLVLTDSSVQTRRVSVAVAKGQTRPGEAARQAQSGSLDDKGRTIKYVEIGFSNQSAQVGSSQSKRSIQYAPPYLQEDYFDTQGNPVQANPRPSAVSAKFGRKQHKLSLGNRLGLNLTTIADRLNSHRPIDRVNIEIGQVGSSGSFLTTGINFAFNSDGIVASADCLYLGANGGALGRQEISNFATDDFDNPSGLRLPVGYDPANLVSVPADQIVQPFYENINTVGGIALGLNVKRQLASTLLPATIETGIRLGIDGATGSIKQKVETGIRLGINAESVLQKENMIETGIRLGLDVLFSKSKIVTAGIKLGTNLGPTGTTAALLMHFDDVGPEGFNETNWVDSSDNNITLSNTQPEGTFTSVIWEADGDFFIPRFGAANADFISGADYVDASEKGGVLSERTSALELQEEWTIEFWIKLRSDDIPTEQPSDYAVICMDSETKDDSVVIYVHFQGLTPYLRGSFWRVGQDYVPQIIDGERIFHDTWTHCAFVKTPGGASLYQNGAASGSFIWDNLETHPTNRIGIGGTMNGTDAIVSNFGLFEIDELRVVAHKAVYTEPTYVVPTGPFSPAS